MLSCVTVEIFTPKDSRGVRLRTEVQCADNERIMSVLERYSSDVVRDGRGMYAVYGVGKPKIAALKCELAALSGVAT